MRMLQYTLLGVLMLVAVDMNGATRRIDRRNASVADASSYYVVFCARGGSATGHAFVAWGAEDAERMASTIAAYGFYPSGGAGVWGAVPGEIRNEALSPKTSLLTDRLIVQVTKAQYDETLALYPEWQTAEYDLYVKNCVAFTAAVARKLGLRVPKATALTFPSEFIRTLIGRN